MARRTAWPPCCRRATACSSRSGTRRAGKRRTPAGRYLDLPFSPTGVYDLDFNRAYHPTCYFDEEFDCPFPPPQNRLPTPVRAGERLPPPEERRMPLTGLGAERP